MDDFEYSVAISDRDWEFFFTECEECNLLPPSLAGVDDSGMSDIDDHYLTQKVRRANSTIGFSENDHPIDSPPHRAGSPVEHSFGKQGIGGIDSVLSGSEEDIHMQSINIFFEKLKGLTEVQPSQERTGNNKEAVQEGGCCDDGQQAIKRSLPKNSSKLNMLPERGETGGGRVTVGSVDTSRPDTIKIVEDESSFSSRTSVFSGYKSDISIKKSFGNELEQLNQYLHSTERLAWSEMTPQSFKVEMGQSMDDNYQESLLTSQEIQNKKCRRSEDHVFTRETSPSISMRRKRKKKRRSMEVDDEEACERRGLIKQGGWKEELPLLREGASLCSSQETLDYLTEPQKSHMNLCTRNPPNINFLKNLTAQGVKTELQHSVSPSDIQNQNFLQKTFTAVSSAGKYSAKLRSEPDPSQSEDNVTSAATDCANEATSLQPCSKIQVEESDGRNQYSKLPVSVIKKSRSQQQDVKAGDHEQSEQIKTSVGDCNNKQNLKCSTAEVKPVSRLSNAESCAPAGEVSQKDNLSAAKLVLAVEAGKAGRDERTLCQSEAESQQQLEKDCHNTNQCHNILENTHCPVAATDKISSHSRACASQQEISGDVTCSDLTSDCIYQIPESYLSNSLSRAGTEKQTCCLIEVLDSGTALTSQNLENKVHRTQNTEPTNRNSDENHTANEQESVQAGKQMLIVVTSEHTNQTESNTMKLGSDRDQTIAAYREPEKDVNSVFAMSSFWNEMEKLTINDILGLRKESLTAPPGSLPPVQEHEETQLFPVANHVSESKLEQIPEKISDSSTLRSVSWECEPVPVSRVSIIYPVSPVLTSVPDSSQPARTEGAQNCLRKISKTVSVHNLQALESESFRYTNETRQILEKQEPEIIDSLPENVASKKENEANLQPSSSESYSISFMDIFQYLFGGKESVSSQSATDEKTTSFTSGNSVPETYDHFFSEFDSENFFYPLIAAEETNKDQMVPIFSCSRSTCRNLQFPEAYEHFFASSSSDDSSAESEEEDNCSPVRVVSRFTRTASLSQFSKDMYEEFFTDKDLQENFFSLKSLSFRKINFTAPTVQNQGSNSLVPVRQTPRYTLKMCSRLNVLGNQDMMFPDPLLDHLEDRISYQLAQQPFTYEDLQSTISNPRLESPFLPLKQSDMCLVCIAFASWVLKTTNPQVGDAWKAVLLANVSALSAIRYLRKYVKTEAASSEIKPHLKALKDS